MTGADVDEIAEGEQHRLVLLVVGELRLGQRIADGDACHHRRLADPAGVVGPDLGQPGRSGIDPPHRHALSHLRHDERLVGPGLHRPVGHRRTGSGHGFPGAGARVGTGIGDGRLHRGRR